jgi:hypothetical protein
MQLLALPSWVADPDSFGEGGYPMLGTKLARLRLIAAVACSCVLFSAARADETPRATLQAAIKAHGCKENLAKTLTGTLRAKAKMSLEPFVEAPISCSWEETLELPRRYRRSIKGQSMGRDFRMEYAITDGSGWIRQNAGEVKDIKVEKLPLSRSWNATLALLPSCLADDVTLRPGGQDKVEGREAVGVSVSDRALGDAVLFFDRQTGLLVKSKRRMQHPLTRKDVDGEVIFGDYKEVSGVQYPRRITVYIDGKKVADLEITRIELLKKVDDRLFEKP